ncbi:hypothetical protein D3C81_2197530 [compost metagenome]
MTPSPYLSDIFPVSGLITVSVTAYTKKKVPVLTSIFAANSGKKVVIPPKVNDKKNVTIAIGKTVFS